MLKYNNYPVLINHSPISLSVTTKIFSYSKMYFVLIGMFAALLMSVGATEQLSFSGGGADIHDSQEQPGESRQILQRSTIASNIYSPALALESLRAPTTP